MTDLLLCSSCERHFRPSEARCPFCDAAAPARGELVRAPKGLSRARLYALHTAALATSVAVAVACGSETTTGTDASTDGNSGEDATSADATNEVGFSIDSSSEAAADASSDVVEDDGWGPPPPPYGCVFPGGCGSVTV